MENNTPAVQKNSKLPTLQELNHDLEEAFKNDQLNLLLNSPIPKDWVRFHPMAKVKDEKGQDVPLSYLPISRVEYLMTKIFQRWRLEVKETKQLFNSVAVTVRLHYQNPLNGEWDFQDGVGAVNVQLNKGAKGSDIHDIKHSAVQMALPAAESYAFKDAAEKLGRLFGKDLGRQESINFSMSYDPESINVMNIKKEIDKFKSHENSENLLAWWFELPEEVHNNKDLMAYFQKVKNDLDAKGGE